MPDDWKSEYTQKVLQARRRVTQELPQRLVQQMAREYARQIGRILEATAQADNINEAWANNMLGSLSQAFNRYAARSELVVKDVVEQAVRETVDGHRQGLAAASGITGIETSAQFGGVPERAIEAMFVRRDLDITRSYKTLTKFSADASAEMVEDALMDAVAGGDTYEEATNKIMRGLVQGDEELEAAVERFGPRGGLRWGQTGPINDEVADQVRKIGFNARRIALTEMGAAHHEADRLSSIESPVVEGVKWTLSGAHPRPDICDILATQNVHDMGPGVYNPATVPAKPHPFCLCFMSRTYHRPQDWGTDVEINEPDRLSQTTVKDVLSRQEGTPTEREVERTTEHMNSLTRQAHEMWTTEEV